MRWNILLKVGLSSKSDVSVHLISFDWSVQVQGCIVELCTLILIAILWALHSQTLILSKWNLALIFYMTLLTFYILVSWYNLFEKPCQYIKLSLQFKDCNSWWSVIYTYFFSIWLTDTSLISCTWQDFQKFLSNIGSNCDVSLSSPLWFWMKVTSFANNV